MCVRGLNEERVVGQQQVSGVSLASQHEHRVVEPVADSLDSARSRWRIAGAVLAAVAVMLIVSCWGSVEAMVTTWWRSATFNHGFMIPAIAAWLVWRQRTALAAGEPRPTYRGIAVTVAASGIWLLGHVAGAMVVEQFALITMFNGVVLAVLGWSATRLIAFPLLYLYFAVPAGEFLIPFLQNVTAEFAIQALQLTGVPALLDGVFIHLPTGSFEVAKACAGLNFLISTVALAALLAHLLLVGFWRRITFLGIALAVPVAANGIRVYGIILIAYLTNNRYAVQVDHIIYGWIFLTIVTLIVLGIGLLFRQKGGRQAMNGVTVSRPQNPVLPPARVIVVGLTAALAAITGPVYAGFLNARDEGFLRVALRAPSVEAPWFSMGSASFAWQPAFPLADARVDERYGNDKYTVSLSIAYFGRQRQGVELTGEVGNLSSGRSWQRAETGIVQATVDGAPMRVRYSRIVSGSASKLVWHWYWIGGMFTSSPHRAKLLQAKAELLGGTTAAAVLVAVTDIDRSPGEAARVLDEFLRSIEPLQPLLTGALSEAVLSETEPSGSTGGPE